MKGKAAATTVTAAGHLRSSTGTTAGDVARTVLTVAAWTATLAAGFSAFCVQPAG